MHWERQLVSDSWEMPNSEIVLSPDEIHIWQLDLRTLAGQVEKELDTYLTIEERNRVSRMIRPADQRRQSLSFGFQRTVLSRYLTCHPASIILIRTSNGKPELQHPLMSLCYNTSHSGEKIVLAVSTYDVGIDIESFNPRLEMEPVAGYAFSINELHALEKDVQKNDLFYYIWTRKEALLKAQGIGLKMDVKQIDVLPHQVGSLALRSFKYKDAPYYLSVATKALLKARFFQFESS